MPARRQRHHGPDRGVAPALAVVTLELRLVAHRHRAALSGVPGHGPALVALRIALRRLDDHVAARDRFGLSSLWPLHLARPACGGGVRHRRSSASRSSACSKHGSAPADHRLLQTPLLIGAYAVVALAYSTIYQATVKLRLWQQGFQSIELAGTEVLDGVKATPARAVRRSARGSPTRSMSPDLKRCAFPGQASISTARPARAAPCGWSLPMTACDDPRRRGPRPAGTLALRPARSSHGAGGRAAARLGRLAQARAPRGARPGACP